MNDKKIVNIQLTKTKSVAAVEIGKDKYVDADGVVHENVDADFISDTEDISEEEKHTFKYMSSLYDGIAELEAQKRAIDEKIVASKKEINKAKFVIRNLQDRMSIADFAEEVGDKLPEGLFDEMVDKEFWCCTTLPGEGVDENAMYILNIRDVSLRKGGLESLPFMYKEYGDWEMYKNAEEYLKYQRIVAAYANNMHAMHDKLVRDIENLKSKRDSIKAKMATAKAQKHMNQVLSGGDKAAESIDAFERYEAKADKMLDEAAAMTELNKTADDNTADSLLDKYKNGGGADVDDELEKMKKELGL